MCHFACDVAVFVSVPRCHLGGQEFLYFYSLFVDHMNLSVPAETDTNFIRQVQINNDSRGEQNSLSCAYPNQFGYKPERARKTSTKRETPLEKSSNNQTINICKVKRVREQQLRQQPKTLLCTIFCVRVCFCVCVSNTPTATAIQTLCDNGLKEISLLSFPMNLITSAGRLNVCLPFAVLCAVYDLNIFVRSNFSCGPS